MTYPIAHDSRAAVLRKSYSESATRPPPRPQARPPSHTRGALRSAVSLAVIIALELAPDHFAQSDILYFRSLDTARSRCSCLHNEVTQTDSFDLGHSRIRVYRRIIGRSRLHHSRYSCGPSSGAQRFSARLHVHEPRYVERPSYSRRRERPRKNSSWIRICRSI